MILARLGARPTSAVLAGRLVAQGGFFAFAVFPAFVLDDGAFNELTIAVTVVLLMVVAPVSALQLHLVRAEEAPAMVKQFVAASAALAVPLAIVAVALLQAFGGSSLGSALVAFGGIANVAVTAGSSCLARGGRFLASAATDASSGVLLGVTAFLLVLVDASSVVWALSYALAWVIAAAITMWYSFRAVSTAGAPRLDLRLSTAWPMVASGLLSQAFNRLDYLVLTVVAIEAESARYVLAARFVGPILIALGSLNNSLYVHQIERRDRRDELVAVTNRVMVRTAAIALAWVPLALLITLALNAASDSFAERSLIVPVALLSAAAVPFAVTIPWAFGLNAIGHERTWLAILGLATAGNVVSVALFATSGAVACAAIWLITQLSVAAAVFGVRRRFGLY